MEGERKEVAMTCRLGWRLCTKPLAPGKSVESGMRSLASLEGEVQQLEDDWKRALRTLALGGNLHQFAFCGLNNLYTT